MALPNVSITIANGGLGRLAASRDGVAGMILTNQVSTPFPLGTVRLFTSPKDVEALAAELTPHALKELREFYLEAGEGAELYVLPVANTVEIADIAQSHINTLKAASGDISLVGISLNPDSPATEEDSSIPEGLAGAFTTLQSISVTQRAAISPVLMVLGVYGFDIADVADLPDKEDGTASSVLPVLACSDDSTLPAVGLALGRLAAKSIATNIGRVKDGATPATVVYIGGQKLEEVTSLATIHNRGYAILRSFPGRAGYYWADDQTFCPQSDDLSSAARNRVINKALILTYDTYVEEINDTVQVDTSGRLPMAVVKYLEGIIESRIERDMGADISAVKAFINPTQNILSSDKLEIEVRIVPLGYLKEIVVSLGFSNPFTSN